MATTAPTNPPVEYATKADLAQLRSDIRGDLHELHAEIRKDIIDLQHHITDLQRTMIYTLVAMTAIFGTLVTILKLFA